MREACRSEKSILDLYWMFASVKQSNPRESLCCSSCETDCQQLTLNRACSLHYWIQWCIHLFAIDGRTVRKNQSVQHLVVKLCHIKYYVLIPCVLSYHLIVYSMSSQPWTLTWECGRLLHCWTSSMRSDGSSLSRPPQLPIIITASRWQTYRWGGREHELYVRWLGWKKEAIGVSIAAMCVLSNAAHSINPAVFWFLSHLAA